MDVDVNTLGIGSAIPNFGIPGFNDLEFQAAGNAGVFQLAAQPRNNRQMVRFYWHEVFDPIQTKESASPVYKKVLMVEIRTPGDQTIYEGVAEDYHKKNYWNHYKAFMEGKGTPQGRPIEQCTDFITGPEITDLKYLGVHTAEQLADASDFLCQQLVRGFELRDNARMWCKITKDTALLDVQKKLTSDLGAAQETIRFLQDEMRQMKERMDYHRSLNMVESAAKEAQQKVETEAPKKRGRPAREVTNETVA